GLRALPAHERHAERAVRTAHGRDSRRRGEASRRGSARDGAATARWQPQAARAVGWSTPTRRTGAGAREPAQRAAARRTAWSPRSQATQDHAVRTQTVAAAGRYHVHLRHARPG